MTTDQAAPANLDETAAETAAFFDSSSRPVYLVEADPARHGRYSLHTLTARHLLTLRPAARDVIYASGTAMATWSDRSGISLWVELWREGADNPRDYTYFRVTSHPGRSALLGEDGLEDAYGHDVLTDLVAEHLDPRPATTSEDGVAYPPRLCWATIAGEPWRYAPVHVTELPDPDEDAPQDRGASRGDVVTYTVGADGRGNAVLLCRQAWE